MNNRHRTDRQMADYWDRRVAELEALRPITASEAMDISAAETAKAEACNARIASAEDVTLDRGRVAQGESVASRDRRNAAVIGASRESVRGDATRAVLHRLRAEEYRRIADEPEGTALGETIAIARQRAGYYSRATEAPRTD